MILDVGRLTSWITSKKQRYPFTGRIQNWGDECPCFDFFALGSFLLSWKEIFTQHMDGNRQKWGKQLWVACDDSKGWQKPWAVQSLSINAGFVLNRNHDPQLLPLTKGIQLVIYKLTVMNEGTQPGVSKFLTLFTATLQLEVHICNLLPNGQACKFQLKVSRLLETTLKGIWK